MSSPCWVHLLTSWLLLKVYYISRGQLKTANKQYSTLNNDYEMTFTNETVIEPCHETDNLPHIALNLVQLAELTNKNPNDIVGKSTKSH